RVAPCERRRRQDAPALSVPAGGQVQRRGRHEPGRELFVRQPVDARLMRRRNALAVAGAALALATQGWSQSPPPAVPRIVVPPGSGAVEQTSFGTRPAAALAASFDGLGAGVTGPQGPGRVPT